MRSNWTAHMMVVRYWYYTILQRIFPTYSKRCTMAVRTWFCACFLSEPHPILFSVLGDNGREDFRVVSGVLRLSTKYVIDSLRSKLIEHLSAAWPSRLRDWDAREAACRSYESESGLSGGHLYPSPIVRTLNGYLPCFVPLKRIFLVSPSLTSREKLTPLRCSQLPSTSFPSTNLPKYSNLVLITHYIPIGSSLRSLLRFLSGIPSCWLWVKNPHSKLLQL